MIRLHQTTDFARPVDKVFACTGHSSHAAQWDPGIADSRTASRGPIGVGTVFELRNRLIVPGPPAFTNACLSSARWNQDVLR
jgi:hypothetical protein